MNENDILTPDQFDELIREGATITLVLRSPLKFNDTYYVFCKSLIPGFCHISSGGIPGAKWLPDAYGKYSSVAHNSYHATQSVSHKHRLRIWYWGEGTPSYLALLWRWFINLGNGVKTHD